MDILLKDEGIRRALKKAMDEGQLYGDDGEPLPSKQVARDQLKRTYKILKKDTLDGDFAISEELWVALEKAVME